MSDGLFALAFAYRLVINILGYPLALVASSIPCAWVGAQLRQRAIVPARVGVDRVAVVALLAGDRVH